MGESKPNDKKLHKAINKAMKDEKFYGTLLELEAAQAKRIEQLQEELYEANDVVEFWMGEGDSEKWPPENQEWRKLISIPKKKRTSKEQQRILELVKVIRFMCDEKLQYERAEQLKAELGRLRIVLETKSYDLLLPGLGERKDVYCCSICGGRPHKEDCKYGQVLKG